MSTLSEKTRIVTAVALALALALAFVAHPLNATGVATGRVDATIAAIDVIVPVQLARVAHERPLAGPGLKDADGPAGVALLPPISVLARAIRLPVTFTSPGFSACLPLRI